MAQARSSVYLGATRKSLALQHFVFGGVWRRVCGGGGGDAVYSANMTLFPAVYNNGGVVADVNYIMTAGLFAAPFAAAGFASENGFIANVGGVATPGITFLTSTGVLGALPLGTAEFFTTLTKDGVTNLSRWLVRLGP